MTETQFTPFDADAGLIFATRLPGAAADFADARRDWSQLDSTGAPPLWVHLDRTRPRAQQWLRTESKLDPMVVESLLAEETRPGVHPIGDGLLAILRGVNLNPGAEPDDLITIRMWLHPERIVTLRQFRFQTIADLRRRAETAAAPASAGDFLCAVAAGITERFGPSVANLQEMLDDVEESLIETDAARPSDRTTLTVIRRQAITYRRYLVPQRDALLAAATMDDSLLSSRNRQELRIAAEQVARVAEALEEVRDRAAVTQDEIRARHEARVGRTLYLLTIVATIAMPLGLITGLLGINVGGVPLANSPTGFAVVCGLLALLAVGEIVIFKVMKWL